MGNTLQSWGAESTATEEENMFDGFARIMMRIEVADRSDETTRRDLVLCAICAACKRSAPASDANPEPREQSTRKLILAKLLGEEPKPDYDLDDMWERFRSTRRNKYNRLLALCRERYSSPSLPRSTSDNATFLKRCMTDDNADDDNADDDNSAHSSTRNSVTLMRTPLNRSSVCIPLRARLFGKESTTSGRNIDDEMSRRPRVEMLTRLRSYIGDMHVRSALSNRLYFSASTQRGPSSREMSRIPPVTRRIVIEPTPPVLDALEHLLSIVNAERVRWMLTQYEIDRIRSHIGDLYIQAVSDVYERSTPTTPMVTESYPVVRRRSIIEPTPNSDSSSSSDSSDVEESAPTIAVCRSNPSPTDPDAATKLQRLIDKYCGLGDDD